MLSMRRNETQTMLSSPLTFQVGASNSGGIGIGIHVGEVSDEKVVGKGDSKFSKVRCRVQIGCYQVGFKSSS